MWYVVTDKMLRLRMKEPSKAFREYVGLLRAIAEFTPLLEGDQSTATHNTKLQDIICTVYMSKNHTVSSDIRSGIHTSPKIDEFKSTIYTAPTTTYKY